MAALIDGALAFYTLSTGAPTETGTVTPRVTAALEQTIQMFLLIVRHYIWHDEGAGYAFEPTNGYGNGDINNLHTGNGWGSGFTNESSVKGFGCVC